MNRPSTSTTRLPAHLQEQPKYAQMEGVAPQSQESDRYGFKNKEAPKGNVMNAVFLALSLMKRRRFDQAIQLCDDQLALNPYDEAVWFVKARAITEKNWLNDTELEEEGVAEILMDENAISSKPRPGTSLRKPMTKGGLNQNVRPITGSGRPVTGFARPGTQSRGQTGVAGSVRDVATAFRGNRPGTSRPVSMAGRYVRLGTASMLSDGKDFVNLAAINFKTKVKKPAIAKALCDYLIYVEHNAVSALELCAVATQHVQFKDWWWKARLGKCYYQLGMFRDAEAQFKSANKDTSMITTTLEQAKIYLRLDQPQKALKLYKTAMDIFPGETSLLLGRARVYDMLNDLDAGVKIYREVLKFDSSNCESMACLASNHFYTDQPELALRYFRRLLQMGVQSTELWNNIGLCCFYASQYDMTLSCFEKALQFADDDSLADVWYNIGQVAIGIGDLNLAFQVFKIAVASNHHHAESFNNLGVLELRKGFVDQAASNFHSAAQHAPHMFQPFYNSALIAFKLGNCQESFTQAQMALAAYPEHADTHQLLKQLRSHLTML